MALDGGYYGSHEHAMANLYIGRRQGREQGHEEGYKEGHADGYNEGYNQAMAEAQQHIQQLQAQYQQVVDHEVMLGNMEKTVSVPARYVLSALMREDTEYAQYVRDMFKQAYFAKVQDSLSKNLISAPLEQNVNAAKDMVGTTQFIMEALQ